MEALAELGIHPFQEAGALNKASRHSGEGVASLGTSSKAGLQKTVGSTSQLRTDKMYPKVRGPQNRAARTRGLVLFPGFTPDSASNQVHVPFGGV